MANFLFFWPASYKAKVKLHLNWLSPSGSTREEGEGEAQCQHRRHKSRRSDIKALETAAQQPDAAAWTRQNETSNMVFTIKAYDFSLRGEEIHWGAIWGFGDLFFNYYFLQSCGVLYLMVLWLNRGFFFFFFLSRWVYSGSIVKAQGLLAVACQRKVPQSCVRKESALKCGTETPRASTKSHWRLKHHFSGDKSLAGA